jgi:hypothetical protein
MFILMLFRCVNVYMNVVLCFVGFACIHEFINVVDAWIINMLFVVVFMGLFSETTPWFFVICMGNF